MTNVALRKDVSAMAASIADHNEAINKLKSLPDQVNLILEMLSNSQRQSDEMIVETNEMLTDQSDPISALLGKSSEGMTLIKQARLFNSCTLHYKISPL
jgi:hypothetical protein